MMIPDALSYQLLHLKAAIKYIVFYVKNNFSYLTDILWLMELSSLVLDNMPKVVLR